MENMVFAAALVLTGVELPGALMLTLIHTGIWRCLQKPPEPLGHLGGHLAINGQDQGLRHLAGQLPPPSHVIPGLLTFGSPRLIKSLPGFSSL